MTGRRYLRIIGQLPIVGPQTRPETVVDHGARVLAFILETSCTATLSETELEHADLAAHYAITARGIHVPAADRISDVRHVIARTLRERREPRPERTDLVDGGQLQGRAGIGGPGDREPLEPRPRINPPTVERLRVPVTIDF